MIFLLIYLLFQSNFLLAVNGNEESIRTFFTNAMRCLQHIARESDRGGYDSMILDRLFFELNGYARTILFFSQQFDGGVDQESFVTLEALHLCFCSIINSFQNSRSLQMSQREMLTSRGPPTIITGRPGRPQYNILPEQITYCLSLGMSWKRIALCFGISRKTLYSHRQNLQIGPLAYTTMSADVLGDIVRDILQTTPNAGERYIHGSLRSRNIRIQRWRLRHCLQELDPIGRALRRHRAIRRRIYNVQTPNQLW